MKVQLHRNPIPSSPSNNLGENFISITNPRKNLFTFRHNHHLCSISIRHLFPIRIFFSPIHCTMSSEWIEIANRKPPFLSEFLDTTHAIKVDFDFDGG